MRLVVLITVIALIIIVPVTLMIVWLSVLNDNDVDNDDSQMNERPNWKELIPEGGCLLEVVNVENGFRAYKTFRGRLILGRRLEGMEPLGFMYLEDDPTISRNQMRITQTSEGFIIENMSDVNVTQLNGHALIRPEMLQSRDYISAGKNLYIVAELIGSGNRC